MSVIYNNRFNSEAGNYFDAITSEGVAVSKDQIGEINKKITLLKNTSIWDKLYRVFLPIWGVQTANQYCLKTQNQGVFNGTVEHYNGYVVSPSRLGWFDTNVIPSEIFSTDSMYVCAYRRSLTGGNNDLIGCYDNFTTSRLLIRSGDGPPNISASAWHYVNDRIIYSTSPVRYGIFSLSIVGNDGALYQRQRTSRSNLGTYIVSGTGTVPTLNNIYAMASNHNGTAAFLDNAQHGFWVIGQGLTDAEDAILTETIKDLWENLTGLTLL